MCCGLSAFIRSLGLFEGVADFNIVTLYAAAGGMRGEFLTESTTGGLGNKLTRDGQCDWNRQRKPAQET